MPDPLQVISTSRKCLELWEASVLEWGIKEYFILFFFESPPEKSVSLLWNRYWNSISLTEPQWQGLKWVICEIPKLSKSFFQQEEFTFMPEIYHEIRVMKYTTCYIKVFITILFRVAKIWKIKWVTITEDWLNTF